MIPKEGSHVTALPFGSQEVLTEEQLLEFDPYEGPTDPVTGLLEIISVPADYDFNAPSYFLYLVDSVSVDPDTIEKSIVASAMEFANDCHEENTGRFCEKHGTVHSIRNFGLDEWPKDRRETVLRTVSQLNEKYRVVQKYGVELSINASGVANSAVQLQSLAAVEDGTPTHIDFHPELGSQEWLEQNDPGTTVSSNNLEHIVIHEFGHVLEATISANLREELVRPFREAQESMADLEDGIGDGAKFENLINTVSHYAGDNVNESIAEAFLQHELGIHNVYSDHVGEVLSRWK